MKISNFNIFVLVLVILENTEIISSTGYEYELVDLLGLGENYNKRPPKKRSLKNSASKFLLEVYNDINENEADLDHVREHLAQGSRQKRALKEENFITNLDRLEIEKCNNIITFSSKNDFSYKSQLVPDITITSDMKMGFTTNDVPWDLELVRSCLRIYQEPSLGKYEQNDDIQTVTITIYEREEFGESLRILNSINTTTNYKGWLDFNITDTFNRWLQEKFIQSDRLNELIVGVNLNVNNSTTNILASDVGLIKTNESMETIHLQPFIIGYFEGPDLITKVQKLRFKRDVNKRKRHVKIRKKPEIFKAPEICQRLNFTVDFEELGMDEWVIAPTIFEAYFCAGGCNFPLGARMNTTFHAIVQTLMHLNYPDIPKPCCAPTKLSSMMILHYRTDGSSHMKKYRHFVVKQCGCT